MDRGATGQATATRFDRSRADVGLRGVAVGLRPVPGVGDPGRECGRGDGDQCDLRATRHRAHAGQLRVAGGVGDDCLGVVWGYAHGSSAEATSFLRVAP